MRLRRAGRVSRSPLNADVRHHFAMSNKRHGQLTTSGQWARHLRPLWKRAFWRKERTAAQLDAEQQIAESDSVPPTGSTVEELLSKVTAISPDATTFELWVPSTLTMSGSHIAPDAAMSLVLDRLLELGMHSAGMDRLPGGTIYQYTRDQSRCLPIRRGGHDAERTPPLIADAGRHEIDNGDLT